MRCKQTTRPGPHPPISAYSPEKTPFEDGVFKLTLTFTEDYPNKAPKVKFLTRVFHPNGAWGSGLTSGV